MPGGDANTAPVDVVSVAYPNETIRSLDGCEASFQASAMEYRGASQGDLGAEGDSRSSFSGD